MRQKEPKTAAQLYDIFCQGDQQLQPWLSTASQEQAEVVHRLLHRALGEPVVVFERIFADYYRAYLLAEHETEWEFYWYMITRMLGYEYEKYYRKETKFLVESITINVTYDVEALHEGRYYSPSDPAGVNSCKRKQVYSLPRFDPRGGEQIPKKTPGRFDYRASAYCESCMDTEQHDIWKIISGASGGLMLHFGKNSTFGKIGKRSRLSACARCGTLAFLD